MANPSTLTILARVFEQEKELFLRDNPNLDEEELQRRWDAKTSSFRSPLGITATSPQPTKAQPIPTLPTPTMKSGHPVWYLTLNVYLPHAQSI